MKKKSVLKIYFRYYLNKSVITSIKLFKIKITLKELKVTTQVNPQSFFIIKTNKGYKTGKDCIQQNISGILMFKIN